MNKSCAEFKLYRKYNIYVVDLVSVWSSMNNINQLYKKIKPPFNRKTNKHTSQGDFKLLSRKRNWQRYSWRKRKREESEAKLSGLSIKTCYPEVDVYLTVFLTRFRYHLFCDNVNKSLESIFLKPEQQHCTSEGHKECLSSIKQVGYFLAEFVRVKTIV